MGFHPLALAACVLAVAPLCAAQNSASSHDVNGVPPAVAAAALPDEAQPARAGDDACVSDALARLFDPAIVAQPLACQYTCRTNSDCPPPPPDCVGGCANRCCVYACP